MKPKANKKVESVKDKLYAVVDLDHSDVGDFSVHSSLSEAKRAAEDSSNSRYIITLSVDSVHEVTKNVSLNSTKLTSVKSILAEMDEDEDEAPWKF